MPDKVNKDDDIVEMILASIASTYKEEHLEPEPFIDPDDILLDNIEGWGLF